ncbi:hypothetical protein [Clostridium ganghwense]|uniref:Uncharacterized protein n=1 Tax=Clostridium ganghwense TaxID=312089 RepID=A0ABT4CU43_9CLOT|nr:hypothetical protein [Clostridium ganghwense]MCY6372438.1 hypothetical protein [Clostridium ganghwense]
MSPEVAKLANRAIIDYLAGNKKEFERLVSKAMKLNKRVKLFDCKYKMNGKWIPAKINWDTGEIIVDGQVIRRCNVC